MSLQSSTSRLIAFALVWVAFFGLSKDVLGQGDTIIIGNPPAGVAVDANGVLSTIRVNDPNGQITRQRIAAAKAALPQDLQRASKMRFVSLPRLEKALIANGGVPTDAMKYLAGLLRVEYVFCYPESGDVVIAGPADGFFINAAGRAVNLTHGRPVLQLQDLAVALRAFPATGRATPLIGCSIDPTQQGLAAMQNFLQRYGSYATPAQTAQIVNGLQTSLGLQQVSINGVSPKTHFAQVMVEADYRMKLIGIGLENPPVKITSFVARANPASVSRNALFRWYFVPDYECVRVTEDGLGMQVVGDGVKLIGEDEFVSAQGGRTQAGRTSRASQTFTTSFTAKYPELADRAPVYAELRNVIDLAVAAAFIQQNDFFGKADWMAEFLGDESKFAVETYTAPVKVQSAINAIWKGRTLMTPIGGGVQMQPQQALDSDNLLVDEDQQVAGVKAAVTIELADGQWWWDAQ